MPDAQVITLSTPIHAVPGVTPALARDLQLLGLSNLGRLVAYLPSRHDRIEPETKIANLAAGSIVSARGEVVATRPVLGARPRFEAVVTDDSGRLDLVWFNMMYIRNQIHPGMRIRVQGKLKRRGPTIQIANPKWEPIAPTEGEAEADAASGESGADALPSIRPVYPATEAVKSNRIALAMRKTLGLALPLLEDHLPAEFVAEHHMPSLREAYRMMHAPMSDEEVKSARRRLVFDELLLLQLAVHLKRAELREGMRAPALAHTPEIDARIRKRFPFLLTPGQESVVKDLVADLTRNTPANRLIQGDVGSGKTLVALYAMLLAVANKQQAMLLAPTELLAEQHFGSIARMLRGSRVSLELLTGSMKRGERAELLSRLVDGRVDMLVGTHALLTEDVRFKSVAVAIIDEQHRFGVEQRAVLRERGTGAGANTTPHVVVMTATPIPRTVAITIFGDLDLSSIKGMPPGRGKITTMISPQTRRDVVYKGVERRLERGEQAYVVVPTIEGGQLSAGDRGAAGLRGVAEVVAELGGGWLAHRRIAGIHGQLKREEREAVMERFRKGEIDVLVATTVIEVGVDVPNATCMVIENADRFGLAQLHQLRGRVGRGGKDSVCVLVADPAPGDNGDTARARLEAIVSTTDGFKLAEKDFELRGPGEVFGTRQSGVAPLRIAELPRDMDLLRLAKRDAAAWIKRSAKLNQPGEGLLRKRVYKAHGRNLGLGDVG